MWPRLCIAYLIGGAVGMVLILTLPDWWGWFGCVGAVLLSLALGSFWEEHHD